MQIQNAKVQRTCVETVHTVAQIENLQFYFSMDLSIKDLQFFFSEPYWKIQAPFAIQQSSC
jgi:hypothetical protein